MSRSDPPRIAILGAGPVGLEAGLYAAALKLPFMIYERGRVAENLQRWGHVKLFTPFGMNTTGLGRVALRAEQPRTALPGEGDLLTGLELVAKYHEPLAFSSGLVEHMATETTVMAVGRKGLLKEEGEGKRGKAPFRLLLRDKAGKERVEEVDAVLDCTGTYGNPRRLGDGGIPCVGETVARPHIAFGIEDIQGKVKDQYADRTTLVIGAGFSAATTVCLLASIAQKHSGTWIIWLARSTGSQPIRRQMNDPLRERDLLAGRANMLATRGEGHVEFHPGAIVDEIEKHKEGFTVHALAGGERKSWQVDRIIANVGHEPDTSLYRELQIHECYATQGPMALATALSKHGGDGLITQAQGQASLRNPEPNFYILGSKSYGRSGQFLLRAGFEQVRDVFALLTGKPDLDLYRATKG